MEIFYIMQVQNEIVTVITPTYNRKKYLKRLYNSLCNQTVKNFKWLIVDDGSTDLTKQQVESFIDEGLLDIIYLEKENGGKHTALNLGIQYIHSPLTFIVDSDDILTKNAIELIQKDYEKILSPKYCGLVYLRGYDKAKVIGTKFVKEGYANLNSIRFKQHISGDKAEVWKTTYLKRYPFPEFEGEKFIGEHLVWCQLSEKYDMYVKNDIIYITEYLPNGLTNMGRKLRIQCPLGGMASSQILTKRGYPIKTRIKNSILYTSYGFFAKKKIKEILEYDLYNIFIILMLPFGYLLYRWWKYKYM